MLLLPALLALAAMACTDDGETADGPIERTSMELASGIHRHLFGLKVGDQVEFEFRSDSEVDLRLLDPAGSELDGWERVIHVDKQLLEAASTGNYKLEIDNSAADIVPTSVTITLRVVSPDEE